MSDFFKKKQKELLCSFICDIKSADVFDYVSNDVLPTAAGLYKTLSEKEKNAAALLISSIILFLKSEWLPKEQCLSFVYDVLISLWSDIHRDTYDPEYSETTLDLMMEESTKLFTNSEDDWSRGLWHKYYLAYKSFSVNQTAILLAAITAVFTFKGSDVWLGPEPDKEEKDKEEKDNEETDYEISFGYKVYRENLVTSWQRDYENGARKFSTFEEATKEWMDMQTKIYASGNKNTRAVIKEGSFYDDDYVMPNFASVPGYTQDFYEDI